MAAEHKTYTDIFGLGKAISALMDVWFLWLILGLAYMGKC